MTDDRRHGETDRRACNDCPNFIRLEEKHKADTEASEKLLREIPPLLSFKNKVVGAIAVMVLVVAITLGALFTLLALFKSEIRESVAEIKASSASVTASVNRMTTSTEALKNTFELSIRQTSKDVESNAKRIEHLEGRNQ